MSEETEPLPPGRLLDRAVAEKMGYLWEEYIGGLGDLIGRWVIPGTRNSAYDMMMRHVEGIDQPLYSTDIAAAWQVVEFIRTKEWEPFIWFDLKRNQWACELTTEGKSGYIAFENTAPHAICLAFLALGLGIADDR